MVSGDVLAGRAVRIDEDNEVVVVCDFLFEAGEVDFERALRLKLERR
ncbi:MAG: hypothetical protein ACI8UZ_002196, partial [Akkermansiaceae bacterium]